MIQPKEGGLSNILNLSVFDTAITSDNLIKLLDVIDSSTLKYLKLGIV